MTKWDLARVYDSLMARQPTTPLPTLRVEKYLATELCIGAMFGPANEMFQVTARSEPALLANLLDRRDYLDSQGQPFSPELP
jgi:hypothetical protein